MDATAAAVFTFTPRRASEMVIESLGSLLRDGGGRTFAPHASPVIVDLRPASAFAENHLVDANSVPIADLKRRMYELPPPGEWPIELLGEAHEICAAQELLTPRGWTCAELDAADAATWARPTTGGDATLPVSVRPNAFLDAVLREVPLPPPGAAIDVGCGGGRDAAYLAQRLPAGWSVHGVDNHVGALGRARELAAACGLSVGFEGRDVRKERCLASLAAPQPLRLVHGCRFLHRPLLLDELPAALAPGGLLVWSTFLDPRGAGGGAGARAGRRLQRGELREALEARGFETLCDEEGELHTKGEFVPAQFFAARRLE